MTMSEVAINSLFIARGITICNCYPLSLSITHHLHKILKFLRHVYSGKDTRLEDLHLILGKYIGITTAKGCFSNETFKFINLGLLARGLFEYTMVPPSRC